MVVLKRMSQHQRGSKGVIGGYIHVRVIGVNGYWFRVLITAAC